MIRFQIVLQEIDFSTLRDLAKQEYREPRQQAALLIKEALKCRGLAKIVQTIKQKEGNESNTY